MAEAVGFGTVPQLTGGIVGYIPHPGDLPQQSVAQPNLGRHSDGSVNHVSVLAIPQGRETEVVVVVYEYTLATLSIHVVESKEESSRVYGLLVEEEGRCGTVRQQQFAGILSEEVHPVIGSNPNMGRNPQQSEAEGVFLNSH